MSGPFILTQPITSTASRGTTIVNNAIYGANGLIEQYGWYTETKFLPSNTQGLITFYPTSDGTSSGDPIFDNIKTVNCLAFIQTSIGLEYTQSIATGVAIHSNTSVDVRMTEAVDKTMLLGKKRRSSKTSTNTGIQVTITISGQLKSAYWNALPIIPAITNLQTQIDQLNLFANTNKDFQAISNLSPGKVVYVNATPRVAYADVNNSADIVFGVLVNNPPINTPATVCLSGVLEIPTWNWTPMMPLFLSTNGDMVQNSTGLPVICQIGIALTATKINIRIERPY